MKTKLWCCVDYKPEEPNYYLPSLAHKKKDSKLSLKYNSGISFKDLEGWKCIKVEVTIKPINEVK